LGLGGLTNRSPIIFTNKNSGSVQWRTDPLFFLAVNPGLRWGCSWRVSHHKQPHHTLAHLSATRSD
jgi:hypothetical protein